MFGGGPARTTLGCMSWTPQTPILSSLQWLWTINGRQQRDLLFCRIKGGHVWLKTAPSADVSQSVRSLSGPTWWVCYSSISPQKNWWIGPVCSELIWHLSNECWWGVQAGPPRANPGVWVSAELFPTLKESLTKKTDTSQQELQMWTCWNIQVKKQKKTAALPSLTQTTELRLLLFFHLDGAPRSPARFRYITEGMDENVLSVKHHFFHGKKIQTGSFPSMSSCRDVPGCSTPWCSAKAVVNPDGGQDAVQNYFDVVMTTQLVLTKAANAHKWEKCPMCAADYRWKSFDYMTVGNISRPIRIM